MSFGTIKLASLLVVVAAGAGVAWQAQQGILHPPSATTGENSADDGTPDDLAASSPEETDASAGSRSMRLTSSVWDKDDSSDTSPKTTGRFQRTQGKSSIAGEPIPARKSVDLPAAGENDFGDDPGANQGAADPFDNSDPSEEQPPVRRRTGTPAPARELTEEEDINSAGASPTPLPTPVESAEDPFGEANPVLLIGNEEGKPARARVKSTATRTTEETPVGDDPFAGAAPPGDAENVPVETTPRSSARTRTSPPATDDSPSLFPTLESAETGSAAPAAPRTRRRGRSTERAPAETDETAEDAFSPDANPEMPADSTEDAASDPFDFGADPSSPAPARDEHPVKSRDSSSDAKTPSLLPVPESSADAETPRSSRPRRSDRRSPAAETGLGAFPEKIKPEELDGDGEPDHAAPKGMQQPRLTIEKVAPKQAVLGQPLIYTVVVKNAGSADAHQVTVEDRIPKGTKLEGTSPRAELIDKKLVWKLGTLKPDEQRKISIKVIPQEQGPIGSVAKVNFVAEIAAEIEVTAPQVLLTVEAPSQVRLGEKLHMVFKIRNAGRADAENVIVRNLIPDGLRHPAGNDLEYAMGTLPAQETREIKLDLVAIKNGKVNNQTIITGEHGVKVEQETPVEVIGEQLLLTRTGKNRLFVDKAAVFTSTVTNEGTASAAKVQIAEVIPAGLEFVSASDNGKFDPRTRAVTWMVGPIGPGEELKLSTKLLPKQLGEYRSTVTVTGQAGSVATVDAELKIDGFPAVAVESKSDMRLISVGERATIRIHCKNQGTAAAKNLVLTADLPPEVKLVDGNGPAQWNRQGNVIAFEAMPILEPDETATFEFRVEGLTEGDTRIEIQIAADHLTRPLRRDETIRVAPEAE